MTNNQVVPTKKETSHLRPFRNFSSCPATAETNITIVQAERQPEHMVKKHSSPATDRKTKNPLGKRAVRSDQGPDFWVSKGESVRYEGCCSSTISHSLSMLPCVHFG